MASPSIFSSQTNSNSSISRSSLALRRQASSSSLLTTLLKLSIGRSVHNLGELARRMGAHALGWRVRRHQVGELLLDGQEFPEQPVVLGVGHDGCLLDVVQVIRAGSGLRGAPRPVRQPDSRRWGSKRRLHPLLCGFVFIGNRVGGMVDRGLII